MKNVYDNDTFLLDEINFLDEKNRDTIREEMKNIIITIVNQNKNIVEGILMTRGRNKLKCSFFSRKKEKLYYELYIYIGQTRF